MSFLQNAAHIKGLENPLEVFALLSIPIAELISSIWSSYSLSLLIISILKYPMVKYGMQNIYPGL